MNREIKFRAWHPTQKMTLTPILKRNDFSGEVYCEGYRKDGSRCLLALMQYTGLKDKNGVEIYEGDIVKIWDRGWNCGGMGDKQINSLVEFKDGCFTNAFTRDAGGIEVIGNTYENPELLNK